MHACKEGAELSCAVCCALANTTQAAQFNKLVWRARVITESFRHFVENEWFFSNNNVRSMGLHLKEDERYRTA